MVQITHSITTRGGTGVNSLNGRIRINQSANSISVLDKFYREVVRIDSDGFHFLDGNGKELLKLNGYGLTQYTSTKAAINLNSSGLTQYTTDGKELLKLNGDGLTFAQSDGTRRVRIGLNPANKTKVGEWISKDGTDVISALGA